MKKEYFTIPNLMGYFRILMIPVFLVLYFKEQYPAAFTVLALSVLSDFLDGKIARRFNMVTDFGKMLDPIADKLTQAMLAIAVTFRYPLVIWLLLLFIIKEMYMGVIGLYLIRKGHRINGAQWYGKVCTAVLDGVMFMLVLLPNLSYIIANILILLAIAVMLFSFCSYLHFHIGILKGHEGEKKKSRKRRGAMFGVIVVAMILYLVLGASLPYRAQPEVGSDYRERFHTEDFYSDTVSCDRAAIVEENGDALKERIRLIERAQHSIIMSTFDFRSDEAGKQMIAALMSAAERGVEVRILVDGFNSVLNLPGNPYFYALAKEPNVEIRIYNQVNPLLPWKGMSRMHDKYLIEDEEVYILGGRNTFNYFLGDQDSHKNYDRDVLVYNTGGQDSSIYQVISYFEGVWNLDCCKQWHGGKDLSWLPCVQRAEQELIQISSDMKMQHPDWYETLDYTAQTVAVDKITLLSNPTGLYPKEPWVFYGLCKLMAEAEDEVWIHTPYIMCNDDMYEAFTEVCKNDADILLMTNSIANNGNPFGAVDYAMHKADILATGLSVLEYEGGISYHAKSMIIDDHISIVGSFNMDMKSMYQDTELMLVIDSEPLNAQLRAYLSVYQQEAEEAVDTGNENEELFYEGISLKKRIQRAAIKLVDPWLRFLM